MPVFSLDNDVLREDNRDRRTTCHSGVGNTESVLWAGWDILTNATDGSGDGTKPRYVHSPCYGVSHLCFPDRSDTEPRLEQSQSCRPLW